MADFDDIFGSNKGQSSFVPFDKESWVLKKMEERQAAYDRIDEYLNDMKGSSGQFRTYLDVQSRFERYSVSNAILIAAQMPTATRLADFTTWREQGVYIKKGENAIDILEPGQEYTRQDGSVGVSYNVKKMFDISQTGAAAAALNTANDERALLKALIKSVPSEIRLVDTMPDNLCAQYREEENVIVVRRGMNAPDIFRGLTQEIARAYLAQDERRPVNSAFTAYCVSYMLSKRYDMAADEFNFGKLPEEYAALDNAELKADLTIIREIAKEINTDMGRELTEQQQKKAQNKDWGAR